MRLSNSQLRFVAGRPDGPTTPRRSRRFRWFPNRTVWTSSRHGETTMRRGYPVNDLCQPGREQAVASAHQALVRVGVIRIVIG